MVADLDSEKPNIRRRAREKLSGQPDLIPEAEATYFAFEMLKRDRPMMSGGFGPIPFSSIRSFADEYELTQPERDQLIYLITTLDDFERNLIHRRIDEERKRSEKRK